MSKIKPQISAYSIYAKRKGDTYDSQSSDSNSVQSKSKVDDKPDRKTSTTDQSLRFNGNFIIPLVSKSVGDVHSRNPRKKRKAAKRLNSDDSPIEGIQIATAPPRNVRSNC